MHVYTDRSIISSSHPSILYYTILYAVRKAGVRAVKQAMCTTAEELKTFVSSLAGMMMIVMVMLVV